MKRALLTMLLLLGLATSAAQADSKPYAATRSQDGRTEKVYTNAGSAKFQRVVRRQGSVYQNKVAPPKVRYRKPAPAPAPPRRPAVAGVAAGSSPRFSYSQRDASGFPRYLTWMENREGRWEPRSMDLHAEVDRLARVHDVDPLLIKALIRQESNFDPAAQSPVGAIGLMQLMPETAADLGVNAWDPAQNLQGGVAYLADQLRRFGDVRLALAAYNAGPGAVQDCGGVPPYEETQNYVWTIFSHWRSEVDARRS